MNHELEDRKLLQDSFWRERVFGFRELSEEKIRKRMEYLDLHLNGPHYCVILFAPYLMEKDAEVIDRVLMNLLRRVREEYRKWGIECCTISDNYCNIVSILSLQSEDIYRNLGDITRVLAEELIRRYDVNMYVGIGSMVDALSVLHESKDTAAEALAYKFTFAQDHVIAARDVKRFYNQGDTELKVHCDRIMGCFYDDDLVLMARRLRDLTDQISKNSNNALDSVRNICIELMATVLRVAQEMGIHSAPEMEGVYTQIARMDSIERIENWFVECCAGLLQRIREARKDKTQQILEMAEEYINANLGRPELSIQSVSDHVDLSAPYFSGIFFRAKGVHINEYINRCRVQSAQRQLLEGNDKVASIAKSLGFSSPNYFNSVFKRYTGISPKRFRESCRK